MAILPPRPGADPPGRRGLMPPGRTIGAALRGVGWGWVSTRVDCSVGLPPFHGHPMARRPASGAGPPHRSRWPVHGEGVPPRPRRAGYRLRAAPGGRMPRQRDGGALLRRAQGRAGGSAPLAATRCGTAGALGAARSLVQRSAPPRGARLPQSAQLRGAAVVVARSRRLARCVRANGLVCPRAVSYTLPVPSPRFLRRHSYVWGGVGRWRVWGSTCSM